MWIYREKDSLKKYFLKYFSSRSIHKLFLGQPVNVYINYVSKRLVVVNSDILACTNQMTDRIGSQKSKKTHTDKVKQNYLGHWTVG